MSDQVTVICENEKQGSVVKAILAERVVQDHIWGGHDHDMDHSREEWVDLFKERYGKIAASIDTEEEENLFRRHAIELAALVMAALEVEE